MRICVIGKFPPIQGGVSMRTYRTAYALAAQGHEVHVVTNAKEATPPFRLHMRTEDWERCETQSGLGSVQVHWTDPVDRSQFYTPMASPFVSKLAAIAGRVHSEHPFDVIYSHYMEPYGVAGHLVSQMTGVPHVVRMAGSDAGRLWHHSQLETLYDHVLRSAHIVVAVGVVAERAVQHGVDPARIVSGGGYLLPEDSFTPEGITLDFASLRKEVDAYPDLRDMLWGGFAGDKPYFGIYGKIGENKGSFALLAAMRRLKAEGLDVGLVALAHGRPDVQSRFRERVRDLDLTDRVLQIPFLPHWRVPEFLRGCLAVCCLEQNFPIGFHSPIIPLEVLLCGSCLVASTEVIRKLPQWDSLPHGYSCVAVNDVNDVKELSGKLAAIVREPQLVASVGARGRAFAQQCQQGIEFPATLERILEAAADRKLLPPATPAPTPEEAEVGLNGFPLAQLADAALDNIAEGSRRGLKKPSGGTNGLPYAQQVLAALQQAIVLGDSSLQPFAQAVEVEVAIAQAELEDEQSAEAADDPLFRLAIDSWALDDRDLGGLMPVRVAGARVLRFNFDASKLLQIETIAEFPQSVGPGPSHIVCGSPTSNGPLLIDPFTARIIELSDGTRTSREIVRRLAEEFHETEALDHLAWIENMFLSGLVGLREVGR